MIRILLSVWLAVNIWACLSSLLNSPSYIFNPVTLERLSDTAKSLSASSPELSFQKEMLISFTDSLNTSAKSYNNEVNKSFMTLFAFASANILVVLALLFLPFNKQPPKKAEQDAAANP
jgi:hypothetical protein